jgi:hypothetical protein
MMSAMTMCHHSFILLFTALVPVLAAEDDAWKGFNQLWEKVKNNPDRMKLLFTERYFSENFSTGAPPYPYQDFHRVRVSQRSTNEKIEYVINRQSFTPVQYHGEGADRHVVGYYPMNITEVEIIFDDGWHFKKAQEWTWEAELSWEEPGVPPKPGAPSSISKDVRVEKKKIAVRETDKEPVEVDFLDRPSWSVLEVLLIAASDLARGVNTGIRQRKHFAMDPSATSPGGVLYPGDTNKRRRKGILEA